MLLKRIIRCGGRAVFEFDKLRLFEVSFETDNSRILFESGSGVSVRVSGMSDFLPDHSLESDYQSIGQVCIGDHTG